jgi:hypothetical protein
MKALWDESGGVIVLAITQAAGPSAVADQGSVGVWI